MYLFFVRQYINCTKILVQLHINHYAMLKGNIYIQWDGAS